LDARALQARVAAEGGHPLLVAFWATWCQPCVEEFPDLVALNREAPGGLQVLAVSLDFFLSGKETRRTVDAYLAKHPTIQMPDELAYQHVQEYIAGTRER